MDMMKAWIDVEVAAAAKDAAVKVDGSALGRGVGSGDFGCGPKPLTFLFLPVVPTVLSHCLLM